MILPDITGISDGIEYAAWRGHMDAIEGKALALPKFCGLPLPTTHEMNEVYTLAYILETESSILKYSSVYVANATIVAWNDLVGHGTVAVTIEGVEKKFAFSYHLLADPDATFESYSQCTVKYKYDINDQPFLAELRI